MKKNYLILLKKRGSLMIVFVMLLLASCVDGYKDDITFSSGVENAQLESPDPEKITVTNGIQDDGKAYLRIEWPVVFGAKGYEVSLYNIDDPDNPKPYKENLFVDGCHINIPKIEDTKFKMELKALGDEKYNNKDAVSSVVYNFTTLIPSVSEIPSGTDLWEYFSNNPIQNSESEQVYTLVSGGNYTVSQNIDFGGHWITLRGDKIHHPKITFAANGGLTVMNGFKIRFIDLDCSAMTGVGVITLNSVPDESLKIYDTNRYIISNPIVLEGSSFKGVNQSLIYGNKQSYVIKNFQILNSIVQLNNSSSDSPVINFYGGSYGCIKDLIVTESTIFNLSANSKAYFIRFANASNAQPQKLGFSDNKASVFLKNNTFYQVMTGKDFGNNLPSQTGVTTTIQNNIFYDCFRINKAVGGSNTKVIEKNILFAVTNPLDNTDKNYGINEDPGFTLGANFNFTPTSVNSLALKAGDPRWLP